MPAPQSKIPVAVLGATGMVGQRLISLLANHPWFDLAELVASHRSAGKPYGRAAAWRLSQAMPEGIGERIVKPPEPDAVESRVVFSALDASAADELEPLFASRGFRLISNARTMRMEPDVPLVVPEVNVVHLGLIEKQRSDRGWDGFVVTNPNCSTIGLSLALAAIHRHAPIRQLVVTTMQAVSGAGYPGVASMDVLDNIVPGIPGEEDKIEREPNKILGRLESGEIRPARLLVSAHTHRVPVVDGHLMSVSLSTSDELAPDDARALFERFENEEVAGLPSAPRPPIVVVEGEQRPQTRLDRMVGDGMAVTVGRIARCPVMGLRFNVLSHNTLRGAAGGTILIAEALASRDLL